VAAGSRGRSCSSCQPACPWLIPDRVPVDPPPSVALWFAGRGLACVIAVGAAGHAQRLVAARGARLRRCTPWGCYMLAVMGSGVRLKGDPTRAGIAAGPHRGGWGGLRDAGRSRWQIPARVRRPGQPGPGYSPGLREATRRRLVVGVVGAVSVAALVLFAWTLASAARRPASVDGAAAR